MRVKVENYRGVKEADVLVTNRMNVLIAANGSGKTSFEKAIKAVITGKVSDADINVDASEVKVGILFDDGVSIERSKKRGKATITKVNGGRTSASSVAPIIQKAFGGGSDKVMDAITEVGTIAHMKAAELSDLFMSVLPLKMNTDVFIDMAKQFLGRELSDKEKALINDLFDAKNDFSFKEIEDAYKRVFAQRRDRKRDLDTAQKKLEGVSVPAAPRQKDAVSADMKSVMQKQAQANADKKMREQLAVQAQRELDSFNRACRNRKAVLERKESLQAQLAAMPIPAAFPETEDQVVNRITKYREAQRRLNNRQAAFNQRIRDKQGTLAALNSHICPITKTACGANMSSAVDVCNRQISSDRDSIQREMGVLQDIAARMEEAEKQLQDMRQAALLAERRKSLEEQINNLIIPELPEAPAPVPTPAPAQTEDFDAQYDALSKEMKEIVLYEKFVEDKKEAERQAEELKTYETVTALCDIKGIRSMVLMNVLTPLEQLTNQKADAFGLRLKFELTDTIELSVAKTGKGFVPFENLSKGERMVVSVLLVYVINKIKDVNILILDDVDKLDKNNTRKLVEMLQADPVIKTVFLAVAEHEESRKVCADAGCTEIVL